ncbi:hypothetical protein [Yinghuangia sp. YIM S09857]|uniref:hypothetical protein n=1 Tax=Yinghuangia sp. YIM S09857 TaxID=3436929 RepID=UPI003F533E89
MATLNRVAGPDAVRWEGTRHIWELRRSAPGVMLAGLLLVLGGTAALFSVVGVALAAIGPACVWAYAKRRLAITGSHLVLYDTSGPKHLAWEDIRHVTLRMTGNSLYGQAHLSVGTHTLAATEELRIRYVETRLFRTLAHDLFTPLHTRGITFIVESPDIIAAEIRQRAGNPRIAPPPGPIPELPDN